MYIYFLKQINLQPLSHNYLDSRQLGGPQKRRGLSQISTSDSIRIKMNKMYACMYVKILMVLGLVIDQYASWKQRVIEVSEQAKKLSGLTILLYNY